MQSLPKTDTMQNLKLLRVLLKEKDTEKIRTQITLFSPLGNEFTEIYLKEISLPNSINALMIIVNKILTLITLPKEDIKKTTNIINNNCSKTTKKELVDLYKIEYFQWMAYDFYSKMNLLITDNEKRDDAIQSLKTEIATQNGVIATQNGKIDNLQKKIDNLQKKIDSICLRDQINNGIDFFTTTPALTQNGDSPSIYSFKTYLQTETKLSSKDKANYEDFGKTIDSFVKVKSNYNTFVHSSRLPFYSSFETAYNLLSDDKKKDNRCQIP